MSEISPVYYRVISAFNSEPVAGPKGIWTKLVSTLSFLPTLETNSRYEVMIGTPECGKVLDHLGVKFACKELENHTNSTVASRHRWYNLDQSMTVLWD